MTEDSDNMIAGHVGHDDLLPEKERANKIAEEIRTTHGMSVRARLREFAEDGSAVFDLRGRSEVVEPTREERRQQKRHRKSLAVAGAPEQKTAVATGPAERGLSGNITPFRSKHLLPR